MIRLITGNLWRAGFGGSMLAFALVSLYAWQQNGAKQILAARLATSELSNTICRASVDRLDKAVEDQNADIIARSQAYYEARTKAVQNDAVDKAAWKTTQERIDALRRSVGQIRPDDCKTPELGL
jgi:hypothetical protein